MRLLKTDPDERPSAVEALKDHVRTFYSVQNVHVDNVVSLNSGSLRIRPLLSTIYLKVFAIILVHGRDGIRQYINYERRVALILVV